MLQRKQFYANLGALKTPKSQTLKKGEVCV